MALTISAVAENKKIDLALTDITVSLTVEDGRPPVHAFDVKIDLGPGLDKRERTILLNSARSCHVHKVLAGETTFDYRLADPEPVGEAAPAQGAGWRSTGTA